MKPKKILIVEDETIISMELKNNLLNLGYTVTDIVNSGEKAMESVRLQPPDIILMDIRLKGKTDGIETAEMIRRKFEIPIVFLTAYMDEERMERAKLTMPFGYILKPVQERDLTITIAMALYTAKIDAERRKAELELKETLQTTQDIVNSIPSGLFIYQYSDPDLLFLIDGNPEAQRLTGVNIKKNIGTEFNEIWSNAANTGITSSYLNVLKTGINYETEDLFYQDSNLTSAYRIRAFSMPNLRLGVAFEDVTHKKQAEIALKRSDDIVNNIHLGLHIYHLENLEDDTSLRLVSSNKASETITGLPNEVILGKLIDENFPAGREKGIPRIYADVVRNQTTIDMDDVNYGDRRVIQSWFRVKAFPLPNDCVGAAFEDIAARKKQLLALQKAQDLYHQILDTISDGFFILDDKLKVTYFSNKAETLLHRKSDEVLGKQLFKAFPEAKGSVFEEKYQQAVTSQEFMKFETFYNQEPFVNWYDVRVHPFAEGILVLLKVIKDRKPPSAKDN